MKRAFKLMQLHVQRRARSDERATANKMQQRKNIP
jgi:hypothetical protein